MAPLSLGQAAPEFEATNWKGDTIRLSDYAGKRLWLAFFRYASCPFCNLRVHDMIRRHEEFSNKGLAILTVFQSPPKRIARYVGKQDPPFPILCDPEERLYRLYELNASAKGLVSPSLGSQMAKAAVLGFLPGRIDGTLTRLPGDFLIDEKGLLVDVFYARDISEHIPFNRVETFLSR